MLTRNTTWTLQRDSAQGLTFIGINYYDGQGFMVKKSAGVKDGKGLAGATVCVQTGTTTELNLADFFRANKLQYKTLVFEKADEALRAYQADRCDSYTTDASGLYSVRLQMAKPDDHIVLPDLISKEPLGPVRAPGRRAVVHHRQVGALRAAERRGGRHHAGQRRPDAQLPNPDIKRILGKEGDFGKGLGLDNDWAYKMVKQLGNYGEIFDRNVGAGSRLKIERGLNRLWTNGGLQYAPPSAEPTCRGAAAP